MIPVDPLAIRAEVGRVLASPGFAHNERLSRFLRFVVERHLEGRGLKVAFFYSKLYLRILRPQWNALLPECDHLPRVCARPLTTSTPKSKNFTRRPLLLPEKLASTVTMSPLEDV